MTMSLPFEHERMAVASALRRLERSLAQLSAALAHDQGLWLRLEGEPQCGLVIRRVCEAYSAIELQADDTPGKSVVRLGVVGAGPDTIALAEHVNESKLALKAVCAPLQRVRTRIPEGSGTRALPLIRVILRSLQRSDLNLLAAYRRIPILGAVPASVAYTRARTRSVYRKTVEALLAALEHSDSPRAIADRARLVALPAAVTHLALVRDHYENIRANVTYDGLDRRGRCRTQVAAELPLLYPLRRQTMAPRVTFPLPLDEQRLTALRQRRSKLEPRPFLVALPVFRYLPDAR